MAHTLHVKQNNVFLESVELSNISEYLADPKNMIWLDLDQPTVDEVALLSNEFNFHPLAIEDSIQEHERARIDAYDHYYLLIFYAADYDKTHSQIRLQRLSLFIGQNFLVSIHTKPIPELVQTIQRWKAPKSPMASKISVLLHGLLDAIVDDYFSLMDNIVDQTEELEDRIFVKFTTDAIEQIFQLKKSLLVLRRAVAPERDVLNVLMRQEIPLFPENELLYVQDVYDHLVRVIDSIDTYRDLLSSALDSYLSLQSNQLNQLVKVLTLASIILMACSLIAGIYGMNFRLMPELDWAWGYPFSLGLMVLISIGLGIFFRSRKWW